MASSSHLSEPCHLVALPYPGRGHINPMMNLCKSLVSRVDNLIITFVVTEEWLGFLQSDPELPPRIRYATIPNVIPSEHVRGQDMYSFLEAVMTKMEASVEELLEKLGLDQPLRYIIADMFLIWAVELGNRKSLPVAVLWPMSTTMCSMCHHFDRLVQNGHFPFDLQAMSEVRVDYIPGVSPRPLSAFPTVMYGKGAINLDRCLAPFLYVSAASCLLLSSVYDLEQQAVDALKSEFEIPVYCIGPSFPHSRLKQDFSTNDRVDYISWLNKQPKKSVLYISFGSFCKTSNEQMDEIAAGLKRSRAKFLWVARSDSPRLRKTFSNTDNGLVVQWCDQLRVLSHDAVSGFWSHCGWSSTQEGFFTGVTFLTFPLVMDQEPNSHMIVEDFKVGLRVRGPAGVDELVKRDEIGEIVKRFMDEDASEVKEMRSRAEGLKRKCERAVDAGGSYEVNFNGFVDIVTTSSSW